MRRSVGLIVETVVDGQAQKHLPPLLTQPAVVVFPFLFHFGRLYLATTCCSYVLLILHEKPDIKGHARHVPESGAVALPLLLHLFL